VYLIGKSERKTSLANCRQTDRHGKIILKVTVKKEATVWNGFVWFKIGMDVQVL
jgi:hypothetical protein